MNLNAIALVFFLMNFACKIDALDDNDNKQSTSYIHNMPKMATFKDYEEMQQFVTKTRKIASMENLTMDTYIIANKTNNNNEKHHVIKRAANANPYDLIKFELADAKIPDEVTNKFFQNNRARQLKIIQENEENENGTIIVGSRKTLNSTKKIAKRSNLSNDGDDGDDQGTSESRKMKYYQPIIVNSGIKTKKSVNHFPIDLQKAINMVVMYDNKQNNIGLKYAYTPQYKPYYGDKLYHNNYYGENHNNKHLYENDLNENFKASTHQNNPINSVNKKYVYSSHQDDNNYQQQYIAPYILTTKSETQETLPRTPTTQTLNDDNHEHSIIQPQNIVEIEPEINYVIQEVSPPSLGEEEEKGRLQIASKPSAISYKEFLSTSSKLEDLLASKSSTTTGAASAHSFYDDEGKEYSYQTPEINNDKESKQYEQIVPYERLSEYEKEILNEHNLYYIANERTQLHADKEPIHYHSQSENNGEAVSSKYESLSSLIGKSTTDQLHGLTHLLEKELMGNKLQQQEENKLKITNKPQENRAPILFHPENMVGAGVVGQGKNIFINKYGFKQTTDSNDHKPIAEAVEEVHGHSIVHITPHSTTKTILPHHANGLSPNYKELDESSYVPKNFGMKLDESGYASKYAFGYRVRDFHTGNDFGHKQNRDHSGVTRGEYHILLPDGRVQNVRYHADDSGFHADVSFETGH